MKSTVVFFSIAAALLCMFQESESRELKKIFVRNDVYDKKPSLFPIATSTYDHAKMKHFVRVNLGSRFHSKMKLYCFPRDPRFCVFYDYFGNVVGVQISILKADVRNVDRRSYNYTAIKDFYHTRLFGIPAYSARVYFTNPEKLTEAGRQNITEVAEGLWTYIDGKLVEIPRCRPNGPRTGTFKMQGCHPRKGTVFINKFGPYDSCKEAFMLYAVYDQYSLVGFGLFAVGYGSPGPLRDWYTHPTGKPLEALIPAPPSCFEQLKPFNFTSISVFLIDNPRKTTCIKCSS